MEKIIKIIDIDNEMNARLLSEILTEKNIPHNLKTYNVIGLDGIFASQHGWGFIEAFEEYSGEIKSIYNDLFNDKK